ncbi:MAG: diacylglycerol kinase family protein [Flavobacteriia bacterium]|nr:diacylglycerol kinase family protein [Flavobacteriia bacterium]
MNRFFRSLWHAFNGIILHIKTGKNFQLQGMVALLVIGLGITVQLSTSEWLIVLLFIGGVLALETFNSALEALSDEVTREFQPGIRKAKDLAAAAVLLFSLSALVGGLLIFIPKIALYFD